MRECVQEDESGCTREGTVVREIRPLFPRQNQRELEKCFNRSLSFQPIAKALDSFLPVLKEAAGMARTDSKVGFSVYQCVKCQF